MLLYWPTYSPWLKPMARWLKPPTMALRVPKARPREALAIVIQQALEPGPALEARNGFRHSGDALS